MRITYETDVVAWSREQSKLLRSGQLADLDLEHIAEEIEDVGRSEQRELAHRMTALLTHFLLWEFQPDHRCPGWEAAIYAGRNSTERRIHKAPSLSKSLLDADWCADAWEDAVAAASKETGMAYADLPDRSPWSHEQLMDRHFLPGQR